MRFPLSILYLSMSAAAGGAILAPISGQTSLFTEVGDKTRDAMGRAVSGAGDVDGDGHADFIAGAPQIGSTGPGYVRVFSGRTGLVLFTFSGDGAGDRFGYAVGGGHDVNGDGVPDFLVGAPGDDDKGADAGSVRLFSGKDGTVLYTLHGDKAGYAFGSAVAFVGDASKDSKPDFVVGAPLAGSVGKVRLFSGPHGTVLHSFTGKIGDKYFGICVSGVGDMNKDGAMDLVVGAPRGVTLAKRSDGYATVFSGASGKEIWTFYGTKDSILTGTAVSGTGDVNLDGVPDVIVGAPNLRFAGVLTGGAWVFSGEDGKLIHLLGAGKSADRYGTSVAGPGDVNGDGYPDLAMGANPLSGTAAVKVFSGKDGKELFGMPRPKGAGNPGWAMAAAGDVNADGVPDLVLGDPVYNYYALGRGAALVFSGARLGLSTDVHTVRVKTSDHCIFTLDAGSAHAGKPYLLVGSFTGTKPGLSLGAVHLPLNFDVYTDFLIANPNSLILRSSGKLDTAGQATADFKVFSAIPHAAAGLAIWHAYVVFNAARTDFDDASNARPLTFAKRY